MPFHIVVRVNKIPQVQSSVKDNNKDAVRKSAEYMRSYARSIAPVLTGAFRASLYINGPDGESDYGRAVVEALAHRPFAKIVPESQTALLDSNVNRLRDSLGQFSLDEAIVAPAVEYGLYLEYGTVHMAPRPTLTQASQATRNHFIGLVQKIANGF
jgi:hypothetical protein